LKQNKPASLESPWPHRLAVLLVCATFPLIWVGGLVTTYDAGMAVPDWPNTYGYNLFAYPWQTWISGPWDLFIEHGHRLLGALVGLITIALTIAVWRADPRRWLRYVVLGALAAVILQGLLGGARVLLDERQLAKIHGCTGPAFFSFSVVIAVVTSRRWRESQPLKDVSLGQVAQRVAIFTALIAFLQLVVGANLRHIAVDASPQYFRILVFFHLVLALALAVHVFLLLFFSLRLKSVARGLCRPALSLVALLTLQILLGAGTWVVQYGWPNWATGLSFSTGYTIQANSWMQANVTTAHVAIGSLILAVSTCLASRSLRLLRADAKLFASESSPALMRALA
jgi:cytochrome c oxidase assembly protein subunit 15